MPVKKDTPASGAKASDLVGKPAKSEIKKVEKVEKKVEVKPAAKPAAKPVAKPTEKSVEAAEKSAEKPASESALKAEVAAAPPTRRVANPTRRSNGARSNGAPRQRGGSRMGSYSNSRNGGGRNSGRPMSRQPVRQPARPYSRQVEPDHIETITGVLDNSRDGHGILRHGFTEDDRDAYISISQVRRLRIRPGDVVEGQARKPKDNERYWGMIKVEKINGLTPEEFQKLDRPKFKTLTPVYPDEQFKLETSADTLDMRIIDMVAPIGKGQRSLLVSPPKAGKTTLLKNIATGIAKNHPEVHLIGVLVGERPEEVTDIRRHMEKITDGKGEVAASNFDESAQDQVRVAELALEKAKRMVEGGMDVVILLDSITRIARAYNLAIPTSGRTLSGGFDPAALFPPKKFFGAARNFEVPGSLTIIGTALVDTGSRMDELIYEEFKGTGNQEIHLDRRLAERRIYPAIDVQRSGTRRDDLMMDPVAYQAVITLHRMLDMLNGEERTTTLISKLKRTKSNKEFLASLKG